MNEKENELVLEYFNMFKELPPLEMMLSYSHPIYQKLMKEAIKTKEPITAEKLDKEIEKNHIKYDMN